MKTLEKDQSARLFPVHRTDLARTLHEFLIDRQARNLTPNTLKWYRLSLGIFSSFLIDQEIGSILGLTPTVLRHFLLHLQNRGHNPGGIRHIYGAVKAFLRWFEEEDAPQGWTNPLRKVANPRTPMVQMQPVSIEDVRKLLSTCSRRAFTGDRDRSVFLSLLDTGCRAAEFLALDIGDVNLSTGAAMVRHGKGRKFRTVFLGGKARRALVRYLRHRDDLGDTQPLWVTKQASRLTYSGLRQIVRRRAERAGIATPSIHSFRHAFALLSLRAGADVYSLQRLMGHADLGTLRRYLAQTEDDLRRAHERSGPVDNML